MSSIIFQNNEKFFNAIEYYARCDRVPVKNPNRLTEDEIRAMVQAICDEPEDENEVGRSDTSDDELIQESDHDTESEQELSVELEEEIEKESEITEEYFFG
ncbi:hypothetical protein TNCT_551711 [Trichonephila clavata]|uniref:Uncharacterized protein n=1 Tax=Trichonephila clavata TaxID=2740835 RepID=A0A8X6F084_TRICU|nr:hypothetical protein TNCT_551711 [Trichonephila clavata]